MIRRLFMVTLCVCLFCLPVSAQTLALYEEQQAASGADQLIHALPADVQELLESLRLDTLQPEGITDVRLQGVLEGMLSLLRRQANGPLAAMLVLVSVVILSALFSNLEGGAALPSLQQSYHHVAVLAAGSAVLVPLCELLKSVQQTVDSVTVFLASYVPVYAAILAAGGSVTGAVSYQTTLLAAVQIFSWLCRSVVLPLLLVSLALGCSGAVTEGYSLDAISSTLHKTMLWVLGLLSTLFSGLLSLQQMAATAGDSLGNRAVKFSLSSLVPVVGGLVSEAYSTVMGCAGLLRSTVGVFGVVATLFVIAPPLATCICWHGGLRLSASAAALFRLTPLEKLCRTAAGAVGVLLALLALFALLMILSTVVVVFTVKG